jgi:hypothetical protein
MLVIHLQGTRCSGKTWAKEHLKNHINYHWDMKQFYKDNNAIKDNGQMDWDIYRTVESKLAEDFNSFLNKIKFADKSDSEKVVLVESSINQTLSSIFVAKEIIPINIYLQTPTRTTLGERAKLTGTNLKDLMDFKNLYNKKCRNESDETYTPIEAVQKIMRLINEYRSRYLNC